MKPLREQSSEGTVIGHRQFHAGAALMIEPLVHETFSQARERFDRSWIEAAARLGLGRSTLYKKMMRLGIVESP